MTPSTIIRDASSAGVTLSLTPQGTINAVGFKEDIDQWRPAIREHKDGIVAALAVAAGNPGTTLSDAQPVERTNVPIWKPVRRRSKREYDYNGNRSTNRFLLLETTTQIPICNSVTWYEEIVVYIRNIKRIRVRPYKEELEDGCAGGPPIEDHLPPGKYRCRSVRLTLKRPTYALLRTLGLMSPRLYHIESVTIANRNETISGWKAEELAEFYRSHAIHKSQVPTKKDIDLSSQIKQLLASDTDSPVGLDFSVATSSPYSDNPAVITLMTFRTPDALKSAGISKFAAIDLRNLRELWRSELVLRSVTFDDYDDLVAFIRRKYEKRYLLNHGCEEAEIRIQKLAEMFTTPSPTNPSERYISGKQQKALQLKFYKDGQDLLMRLDNGPLLPLVHIDNAELLTGGMYCRDEQSDDETDET